MSKTFSKIFFDATIKGILKKDRKKEDTFEFSKISSNGYFIQFEQIVGL